MYKDNIDIINEMMSGRLNKYDIDKETVKRRFSEFLYDYSKSYKNEVESFKFQLAPERKEYWKLPFPEPLTVEQCIEDIEILFKGLKYYYAGYEFFGGDEKFNNAKEVIINKLKDVGNIIFEKFNGKTKLHEPDGRILANILFDFIRYELNFIRDLHFQFICKAPKGGQNSASPIEGQVKRNYTYEDICFDKIEDDFFFEKDCCKYKLISIDDDKDVNKYIKFSINEGGDLIRIICKPAKHGYNKILPCKITIEDSNGIEKIDNIELKMTFPKDFTCNAQTVNYEVIEDIPVITNNICMEKIEGDIERLVETAKKCKEFPVAILDLRGNGGGGDEIPTSWVREYIGSMVKSNRIGSRMNSSNCIDAIHKSLEQRGFSEEIINKNTSLLNKNGEVNGWTPIFLNVNTKPIQNENKIIVLIDNGVASSGETFVALLQQFSNVLFIGMNTMGCGISNRAYKWMLPNSLICVENGNFLFMKPDLINLEGIGYQPDIYVQGCPDMIERTVKFIKKYLL